jgi:hypothetical protein
MSWKRIKHPAEIFKLGDQIEVDVLNLTEKKIGFLWAIDVLKKILGSPPVRCIPKFDCARSGEED